VKFNFKKNLKYIKLFFYDVDFRSKVHSLLRRQLFKDIDLLQIELGERDRNKSGFIHRNEALSACRSLPVPLPIDMLNQIFQWQVYFVAELEQTT